MTREQTLTIIRAMTDAYPNYNPRNLSESVDLWAAMLGDLDYAKVFEALKRFIRTDTSGFAPSIGQLMAALDSLDDPDTDHAEEVWTQVLKAIGRSNYYSEEEFDKLPELAQRAIGGASQLRAWACQDDLNHEVARSNFIKTYNTLKARQTEQRKASPGMMLPQKEVKLLQDLPEEALTNPEWSYDPAPADFMERVKGAIG